jgi:hypothetical protein
MVEEAVDENDIQRQPPSWPKLSGTSQSTSTQDAPANPPVEQQPQAATKPATPKPPVFDGRSEELFPALGGGLKPRAASAAVPVAWSSRKPGFTNGAPSTPPSVRSAAGSPSLAASGTPRMNIPGKHVEQIRFAPSQMLPRSQLKKPVSDIVRDINRRSKARLEVRDGPNGSSIFEGTGSVEAVRQALKEIAQQVGSKVSLALLASTRPTCMSISDAL